MKDPLSSLMFFDTETTGIEGARLVQLTCIPYTDGLTSINNLYKPPIDIEIGAMAVHHITPDMVVDKQSFDNSSDKEWLIKHQHNFVWVAHNAPFDVKVMETEGINLSHVIDTYKVAAKVILQDDQQLESYSLQYLRYALELYKFETGNFIAHDALGDVEVLKNLFIVILERMRTREDGVVRLMEDKDILKDMLRISKEPRRIDKMYLGKYSGDTIEEVIQKDFGYAEWCMKDLKEDHPDLVYNIESKMTEMYQ